MPKVQVFRCPSCGANLSYDGGPDLNFPCPFCGSSVIVPAEWRTQAAPPPEPPLVTPNISVNMSATPAETPAAQLGEVVRLARAGEQVEAVRRMRELNPGLGLKEALDAVNLMAGRSAAPGARLRSGAGRAAGCTSCLFTVLLIGGILAFVGGMLYLPFRLSGSYKQAVSAASSDPSVLDALGAPVQVAWWWPSMGEISCGGSSCSANYEIAIYGPRHSGRIHVMSDSRGGGFFDEGTWQLQAVVEVEGGGQFALVPPPPPEPTASPVDADATQGAAARSTQQARATKTAGALATESAQMAATAEAEAQAALEAAQATAEAAQATAEAEAAQAAAQAVIAAQADWPVLLKETFADNRREWPAGAEKGVIYITTTVTSKKYVWDVVPRQSAYANAFPLETSPLTDFAASVKVKFVRGASDGQSAFGLVFRHVDQDYGFFGIEPGGNFWVKLAYGSGTYVDIIDSNPAINTETGQVNQLAVYSQGTDLIFLINDEVVLQLSEDLPPGDIGVAANVQGAGQPAKVEFSEFEVRAP